MKVDGRNHDEYITHTHDSVSCTSKDIGIAHTTRGGSYDTTRI